MRTRTIAACLSFTVATCAAAAASTRPGGALPDAGAQAGAYCVQTGGVVEHRVPEYGTNGPSALRLAGAADFCQYTSSTDGSRIHVLLETLYATKPSLAALAYYAAPKLHKHSGGGNPASYYCSQLGGSDLFGGAKDPAGGGWYLKGATDEVLEACIFPDMSSIDSWGLAYHSAKIVRGIDLSQVLRYKGPSNSKR